jgi:hypothetical protein
MPVIATATYDTFPLSIKNTRWGMKTIEMVPPREMSGRDTISRFDMQFQAAAYAALEILKGNGVDCVYCDHHDDFVVRRTIGGRVTYHFFQVKTKKKENHQWTFSEVFSMATQRPKKDAKSLANIKASIAGKLLIHGIIFSESCTEVTLLSNVHFDDDVINVVDELRGKAPTSKAANFLSENFSAIFSIEESDKFDSAEALSKMSLLPAVRYIGDDREVFSSAARSAVQKYSEIDLTYNETNEVANGLVDLVYKKSRTKLEGIKPDVIPSLAGVQLDDLLAVLSISKTVYEALLAGEEPQALKAASVIQRWYKKAGANDSMIEFAAQTKSEWDIWLRKARHVYLEFDLNFLLQRLDTVFDEWQKAGADFARLQPLVVGLADDPQVKKFAGLTPQTILGGMNAILVRRYSQ